MPPLVGESLAGLFAPSAKDGLLRFEDGRFVPVPGSEGHVIKALLRSPSGTFFFSDAQGVYRFREGGEVEALSAPAAGQIVSLNGRADDDIYTASLDGTQLRIHRFDGERFRHLAQFDQVLHDDLRELGPLRLWGSEGLLIAEYYVGAKDIDPVDAIRWYASSGDDWKVGFTAEFRDDGAWACQLGPLASPTGLVLSTPSAVSGGSEQASRWERIGGGGSGILDRRLASGVVGDDLEHFVAVLEGGKLGVRDGDLWREFGGPDARIPKADWWAPSPALWYGRDGVGIANDDGAAVCTR